MLGNFIKGRKRADQMIMVLVFVLTVVGLLVLSSASSEIGKREFDNSYHYLIRQIRFGLAVGVAGFLFAFFFPYQKYRKLALPLLFVSIIAAGLVFTPLGPEIRNTHRWVTLGPISFQPAEILKLTFIIYLAAWLSNSRMSREKSAMAGFLPFLIITGLIGGLLVMQPATSTVAILLGAGCIVYFVGGARFRYIAAMIGLGSICLVGLVYTTPYRFNRILSYVQAGQDPQGSSYHLNQALAAISGGEIAGVGYGQSAAKVSSLPEPIDDSIFAILAEEFGFIGSAATISLFGMLVLRLMWVAAKTKDRFGKLLLVGFASIIALQSIVHIAAISGILPLTGVPLPFISYGGTALAVFLTMSGICANVSKYS